MHRSTAKKAKRKCLTTYSDMSDPITPHFSNQKFTHSPLRARRQANARNKHIKMLNLKNHSPQKGPY